MSLVSVDREREGCGGGGAGGAAAVVDDDEEEDDGVEVVRWLWRLASLDMKRARFS